jgi:hypothetical protein
MAVSGNVEGSGLKTPVGELLGVVAETAADYERAAIGDFLRMVAPEIEEMRIGGEVGPRDGREARCGFAVKGFEPAGGISFGEEFGGEFSGAFALAGRVGHCGIDFSWVSWEGANRDPMRNQKRGRLTQRTQRRAEGNGELVAGCTILS